MEFSIGKRTINRMLKKKMFYLYYGRFIPNEGKENSGKTFECLQKPW